MWYLICYLLGVFSVIVFLKLIVFITLKNDAKGEKLINDGIDLIRRKRDICVALDEINNTLDGK